MKSEKRIMTIDNKFYYELGLIIRREREKNNMTQYELASQLSISRAQLINYEYGYTRIKEIMWNRICEIFGIKTGIDVIVTIDVNNDRYN